MKKIKNFLLSTFTVRNMNEKIFSTNAIWLPIIVFYAIFLYIQYNLSIYFLFIFLFISFFAEYFTNKYLKNHHILKSIFLLFLGLFLFFLTDYSPLKSYAYKETEYAVAIQTLNKIEHQEIPSLIDNSQNENIIIYIGKETCPFCKTFVPKLTQAVTETNRSVNYIDAENKDTTFLDFAKKYHINEIPKLIVLSNKEKTDELVIFNEITPQAITDFLTKYP